MITLGLLMFGALAQAQSVRHTTYDRMLTSGAYQTLNDSIAVLRATDANSRVALYYDAVLALRQGRLVAADSLIKQVGKAASQPEWLILSGELHLLQRDEEALDKINHRLDRLRLKDSTLLAERATLNQRIKDLDRMVSNAKDVTVIRLDEGRLAELPQRLAIYNNLYGSLAPKTYITPSGSVRWSVKPNAVGGDEFFVSYRLTDGSWDEDHPVEIKGFDPKAHIFYPYLMPDGATLYFSSDKQGGLGARDIYVSRFDRNSEALLVPQQLPMPINSPFDDAAYFISEENDEALILTDRNCSPGFFRLMTIKPSTLKDRTDNEEAEEINELYLLTPTVQAELAKPLPHPAHLANNKEDQREPILIIRDKRYFSPDDFSNTISRDIYMRLQALQNEYQADVAKLAKLREQLVQTGAKGTGSPDEQVILRLEKQVDDTRSLIAALRNELIRTEHIMH